MDENNQKKKIQIVVVVFVAICFLFVIIHRLYDRNKSYSSYKVEYNLEISDGVDNTFYPFVSGVLKYSSDGISYINDGKEVWNHGFEMKNPLFDVCGEYIAIAESDTNDVNIYNAKGEKYKISVQYPIKEVEVSRQGVVAAVSADEDADYIELVSKDGTRIAIGRTVLDGDGYPLDISISPDATKVAASYLAVSSGEVKTKVVFYNYSEVGQEQTDRIVGGFNDFGTAIIPDIEFVDLDTAIAVGDDILVIYDIKETPSERARVSVNQEILSVVYNERYIALITENEETGKRRIEMYTMNGKQKMSQELDFQYNDMKIAGSSVLLYNDTECQIYSSAGVKKFDYKFNMGITSIVPLDDESFIFVSGKNVQKIVLK